MSTIVCQNLVSCFDSQHSTETTTILKLKVAAPLAPASLDFGKKLTTDDHRNLEFGNWGFLQTIPEKTGDKQSFYAKNSSFSRLSPKSLELCTENLGSETGTEIISDSSSIFSSSPPPFSAASSKSGESFELHDWKQKAKYPHHKEVNYCRKTKSFPPPLTTMSGSSSLQVRRHREGGRLIIEAVEAPFRNSYLQAERSDGRLKLCFMKSSAVAETATSGGEEQEEEEEEGENGDECGGDTAGEEEIDEPRNEFESEKEEFDGEINIDMGMEKFQRLSRCKEGSHGNKGLCSNWKPALWVATS